MSLPISGRSGPPREPTHKPLDHQRLMKLGLAVEEAADDEPITGDAIDELALELGVDASHLYAAAAVTTDVEFAREHPVAFVACAGNCQNWGALERLEHLATLRTQRADDGRAGFDIRARSCLDQCEHAPVVVVETPDGRALLPRARNQDLDRAVAEACD